MKERIKSYLLVITIIYGIVIVLLMLITYCNMEKNIEFEKDNSFYTELNKYKNQISSINNANCEKEITNLIKYIEIHNLEGTVNLKKYNNEIIMGSDSLLGYYSKIIESCSIDKKTATEKGLPMSFLTASVQNDEIIQRYNYQYELSIKDNLIRDITMPNLINVENKIKRGNELNIIKIVLEIVKGDQNER